jgi:hypothetical protein
MRAAKLLDDFGARPPDLGAPQLCDCPQRLFGLNIALSFRNDWLG